MNDILREIAKKRRNLQSYKRHTNFSLCIISIIIDNRYTIKDLSFVFIYFFFRILFFYRNKSESFKKKILLVSITKTKNNEKSLSLMITFKAKNKGTLYKSKVIYMNLVVFK